MRASPSPQTCIILAGGFGTRLREVLADRPKCLAPVGERSFLEIQIAGLIAAGVGEVVLSLGFGADMVVRMLGEHRFPIPVRHVIEPQALGTGGAISYAMDSLSLQEVLVTNGDTFLDGNLSGMLPPLDRAASELFRMAAVHVPDRSRFGGLRTDAARVTGFLEKGQSGAGLINAGLYRLCREALPAARVGAYSLETDVLPGLVAAGHVTLAALDGSFIDIGVPADYARFCQQHAG